MEPERPGGDARDDQDRVVSRHVRNPTRAEPGDEEVYAAADAGPDGDGPTAADGVGAGGSPTSEEAAAEVDAEQDSSPRRSE